MALSKKGKIWLIVIAIPVALVVIGALALKMYFTSERLKALVLPKVEEAVDRPVALRDISLSIFPTLGVALDSLVISNKPGAGFSEQPFVALDGLTLDVRMGPLLSGDIVVSKIVIDRPRIFLEVNEEGRSNYAVAETKGGAVDTGTGMGGKALLLSDIELHDGAIAYVNHKENSAVHIEGLDERMSVDVSAGGRTAEIDGTTEIGNLSYGSVNTALISGLRVRINTNMLYEQEKDQVSIQRGECNVQDIGMNVSGTVTRLSTIPRMDIAIESNNVNIAALLSLAPKEYMKKAEGLKGGGNAQIKILIQGTSTDSTEPQVSGSIAATNATIQYASLPKSISNVNIVADFTRKKERQIFNLSKFSANLGNNPISATMAVRNFDDPSIVLSANASLNLATVKEYYPVEEGTQMSGSLKVNVDIDGKVKNPAGMKASGTMDFRNVTVKTPSTENPLQNLNGTIRFNNQLIESNKLAMSLGKSDLSLSFWLKNYLSLVTEGSNAPKPTANLTLISDHLYTSDIAGKAQQNGQKGNRSTQQTHEGGLPLPDVSMDVSASIGTLTMERFEINNVRGSMKIADGVVTMQNFSFNTFDGSVVSKGTLSLKNPAQPQFNLTMDMNSLQAHEFVPKFTSFGNRLFGKMSMHTTMQGALDDTLGLISRTLEGNGNVQINGGKLEGVKVNQQVASLLNFPDLALIQFNDWTNGFTITDGRMYIKDLKINALDANYIVNGSQGLDGSLDYTMTLLLPEKTSARISLPGIGGEAISLLKDESGRLKLDFSVGGTYDTPKVSLDTETLRKRLEELAKRKVAEEGKKLEEKLKKEGGNLLEDLFKKKKK